MIDFHNSDVAVKDDSEKVRFDLVPINALTDIARVFSFGAKKYSDFNWKKGKGMEWHRLFSACLRHLNSFWDGEDYDKESKFHHVAAAGCNIMMLLSLILDEHGVDDRPCKLCNSTEEDSCHKDDSDVKKETIEDTDKIEKDIVKFILNINDTKFDIIMISLKDKKYVYNVYGKKSSNVLSCTFRSDKKLSNQELIDIIQEKFNLLNDEEEHKQGLFTDNKTVEENNSGKANIKNVYEFSVFDKYNNRVDIVVDLKKSGNSSFNYTYKLKENDKAIDSYDSSEAVSSTDLKKHFFEKHSKILHDDKSNVIHVNVNGVNIDVEVSKTSDNKYRYKPKTNKFINSVVIFESNYKLTTKELVDLINGFGIHKF